MLRTGYWVGVLAAVWIFQWLHGVGDGKALSLGYKIIVGMTQAHSCCDDEMNLFIVATNLVQVLRLSRCFYTKISPA